MHAYARVCALTRRQRLRSCGQGRSAGPDLGAACMRSTPRATGSLHPMLGSHEGLWRVLDGLVMDAGVYRAFQVQLAEPAPWPQVVSRVPAHHASTCPASRAIWAPRRSSPLRPNGACPRSNIHQQQPLAIMVRMPGTSTPRS